MPITGTFPIQSQNNGSLEKPNRDNFAFARRFQSHLFFIVDCMRNVDITAVIPAGSALYKALCLNRQPLNRLTGVMIKI